MKRYNVKPQARKFDWGEMKVIALGEQGRGRHESLIPYYVPEDALNLAIGQSRSGKPKIVAGNDDDNWLALVSGSGTYTRGTYGTVYCQPIDAQDVQVIASGYGAYGIAGRIGNWYEFLVIVLSNTFLKIRPAGGSNKRESYWLYFGESEVVKVRKSEMDMFCELHDLDKPDEEFDKLVDLASIK